MDIAMIVSVVALVVAMVATKLAKDAADLVRKPETGYSKRELDAKFQAVGVKLAGAEQKITQAAEDVKRLERRQYELMERIRVLENPDG